MSGDDRSWFLINASPDLAAQIERAPALQPGSKSSRNSPIAGILLTNADLDHVLGLSLLRNAEARLVIYATRQTRARLEWIDRLLKRFGNVDWRILSESKLDGLKPSSLTSGLSLTDGIGLRVIDLDQSVAFQISDQASGKKALVAPAVGVITDELQLAAQGSDVILFDGTFWDENELGVVRPGARSARQMNHLPIRDGSLEFLRTSAAKRKIYTHINNTNPILMPGSKERAQVEQAGIEIACDGLEIDL